MRFWMISDLYMKASHICMSVYGCFWLWVLLCVLMNVLILMHVHMYAVVGMWVVVGGGGWW
jgi:hypothetical protein